MAGHDTGLIGRDRERAALTAFATATGGPAALVIEGEPGIGKTALWTAGTALAAAAGRHVLRCAPAPAEAPLSFAGLADLLGGVLDEALPGLPGPQRQALEVALLLEAPDGPPPDPRALAAAFLGVLRGLASVAPVTVAVDDLQWLDAPSATVLEFAARRLGDAPVRLLVAQRGSGEGALPLGLGRTALAGGTERLVLGPLAPGPLHQVLEAQLGVSFSRPVLLRLHESSGGNPFFALEIARAVERRGPRERPDAPLPSPESVQQLVQERLATLPDSVRGLLEIVSARFDRSTLAVRDMARELELEGAIDEAIAAHVLQEAGPALAFTHPLLATGVYAEVGPERRRAIHRRLAERDTGEEARALHAALAADGPDDAAAAALDSAAAGAAARGAAATAGSLAESAARLTPVEDREARGRRSIAAAAHYVAAGDPAHARALLGETIDELEAGPVRAEALSLLAWVPPEPADLELAVKLGRQALEEAAEAPPVRAATHLRLAVIESIRGRLAASAAHARDAAALAEALGDPGLLAAALAYVGYIAMLRGEGVVPASRRAAEVEAAQGPGLGQASSTVTLAQVLLYTDALDEARAVLEGVLQRLRDAGEDPARGREAIFHLADLERRAGNWRRAAELSGQARELCAQAADEQETAACLVVGELLDAGMGRTDAARRDALAGLAVAERLGDETFIVHHRGALGFLDLSLGDAEAAAAWLGPASDALIAQGIGELSIYPALQHEIDAVVAIGELARAELLVGHLEQLAGATGRSWTRAIAARGRGLLQAAAGELDAARASLDAALLAHEEVPQPFELARSLLVAGAIQRRSKRRRQSREALERAEAIFTALPAPLWAQRAAAELARLGRRAAPGELSETEARIAALAAAGRTNPEIAAEVFVSRKTVEANLSSVYRKLGIRSRTELARALPAPRAGRPSPPA